MRSQCDHIMTVTRLLQNSKSAFVHVTTRNLQVLYANCDVLSVKSGMDPSFLRL